MTGTANIGSEKSAGALLERVSASRLQTFHQCRLKFYFRYVLKLVKPKPGALHVGSAVHHALRCWNKSRWREEEIDTDRLRESFEEFWVAQQNDEPVQWEEDERAEMNAAWALVAAYLNENPIPLEERPEAVEVGVEMDLSARGLPLLTGFIDLVRSGGRIVDYKTTGQTPQSVRTAHLHELQLSCYGLLYRDATGRREGGFELHHLVKTKTPKVIVVEIGPMSVAQENKLLRSIDSFVQGVQREDWVPSPSPMACACCEYFAECRHWSGERPGHGPHA